MVNEKKIKQLTRKRYSEDGKQYENYIRQIYTPDRAKETKQMLDIILDQIEKIHIEELMDRIKNEEIKGVRLIEIEEEK